MRIFDRTRQFFSGLRRDLITLRIAFKDPRTPLSAKFVGGATVAYALSPIDLIPDFVPIAGRLDDLVIVPLGIWLAMKMIPSELLAEFREAAALPAPSADGGLFDRVPKALIIVGAAAGAWLALFVVIAAGVGLFQLAAKVVSKF